MRYCKNRVTLYFNGEHTIEFKLFFATLEQVNTFILYLKKCSCTGYLEYVFDSLKDQSNEAWITKDSQVLDTSSDYVVKRSNSAPFKVNVHFYATKRMAEFDFVMYCFSALDADLISQLISQGSSTKTKLFSIQHFNRNRDTKEWETREPMTLVPEALAEAYYNLSPQAREQAAQVLSELPVLA